MSDKEKDQDTNLSKIASSTPTPTNFISNPCKFRGKTIEILGVLSNTGGMTSREISAHTGIPIKTVNVYCWLGEKRGIFERKEHWGWNATSFGFFILSINNNNDKSNINEILIKDKSSINHLYTVPKKSHQLNLSIFTSRSDIAHPERVVAVLAQ